jgi:dimethylhistidine N-methyltransferase
MSCRIIDRVAVEPRDELSEVIAGLVATPATLPPKYFYDELGCALYGAITRLPEYYPTRTEVALFREHRADIAAAMGSGRQFVDLGSGDCCKALAWLPFVGPRRYVAVDIAEAEIHRALTGMARDFPELELLGVVTDFSRRLDLEGVLDDQAATFFYPGSSIGNFTPEDAVAFLRQVHGYCAPRPGSGLLIGVDGKKAAAILDAAYDDALGVTAAFNRNALLHLNRRFGFDFVLEGFGHRGFYNAAAGRVEMHLESLRDQAVNLGGHARRFAKGERIHTENSYKYAPAEFEALLRAAGFGSIRRWDSADVGYYAFYAA